jgi:hypothetical protein
MNSNRTFVEYYKDSYWKRNIITLPVITNYKWLKFFITPSASSTVYEILSQVETAISS